MHYDEKILKGDEIFPIYKIEKIRIVLENSGQCRLNLRRINSRLVGKKISINTG